MNQQHPKKLQHQLPSNKTYSNSEVAEYLTNIATAYEIKHDNRFRIISYENAAETVLTYPQDLFSMWQQDPKSLDAIPDIGSAICEKIGYLFEHRRPHPHVLEAFKGIHPAVFTFTKINGIGPIVAHKLTENLHFSQNPLKALDQLVAYAKQGKIRDFPGFGEKSESSILQNTLSFLGRHERMSLADATTLAAEVITYLKVKFPNISFIPLGSLRRLSATVGDIDIAAASSDPMPIIDYFLQYPNSVQTIASGSHKASLRLLHDVRVDLMVKPQASFGALLQHFTGSKLHNILLRRYALKLGYSLSEYGIREVKSGQLHQFADESDFYHFLGLKLIPPTERTGENELQTYHL